jgi:hypothetical protein
MEVDRIGSGSCPNVSFVFSDVEPLRSAARNVVI